MNNTICTGIFALLLLCVAACSHPSLPYTFLIPAGYKGTLRVVFDEEKGMEPTVERGRQILRFPNDGIVILKTAFFNTGVDYYALNKNGKRTTSVNAGMEADYYLVDNKGNKTKVTQVENFKDRLNNSPAVVAGMITVSGYTYHNSKVETKGITYQDFYLYDKNTTEINEGTASQRMDLLTKAAVANCRASK